VNLSYYQEFAQRIKHKTMEFDDIMKLIDILKKFIYDIGYRIQYLLLKKVKKKVGRDL